MGGSSYTRNRARTFYFHFKISASPQPGEFDPIEHSRCRRVLYTNHPKTTHISSRPLSTTDRGNAMSTSRFRNCLGAH